MARCDYCQSDAKFVATLVTGSNRYLCIRCRADRADVLAAFPLRGETEAQVVSRVGPSGGDGGSSETTSATELISGGGGSATLESSESETIKDAFERFHAENPRVYELLRHFAQEVKDAGHKHYGMKSLFERVRWHVDVETRGDDFKLNNNFTAHYARLLNAEDGFEDFFHTRRMTGESE